MSAIITQVFELVGPHKGKTIKLRNYQFVDGEMPVTGDAATIALHARFLGEVNGWAVPKGQAEVAPPSDDAPDHHTPPEVNERLLRALERLDPANNEHWTALGKPAMAAVELLYGSADITRAQVEAVAPTLTRDTAVKPKE